MFLALKAYRRINKCKMVKLMIMKNRDEDKKNDYHSNGGHRSGNLCIKLVLVKAVKCFRNG